MPHRIPEYVAIFSAFAAPIVAQIPEFPAAVATGGTAAAVVFCIISIGKMTFDYLTHRETLRARVEEKDRIISALEARVARLEERLALLSPGANQ